MNTREILFDKQILYQQNDKALYFKIRELITQLNHYVDDISRI